MVAKRILHRHGYPPDKQEKAPQTVPEQAKTLSELWVCCLIGNPLPVPSAQGTRRALTRYAMCNLSPARALQRVCSWKREMAKEEVR